MAIGVHMVAVAPISVNGLGQRIDKSNTTMNDLKNSSLEPRIVPDSSVPNSANYPRIKDYLEAEAASGYTLNHIDQNMIITYGTI